MEMNFGVLVSVCFIALALTSSYFLCAGVCTNNLDKALVVLAIVTSVMVVNRRRVPLVIAHVLYTVYLTTVALFSHSKPLLMVNTVMLLVIILSRHMSGGCLMMTLRTDGLLPKRAEKLFNGLVEAMNGDYVYPALTVVTVYRLLQQ